MASTDQLVQMASIALKGKIVLITGGTGGIGSSMARLFLRAGCTVAITSTQQSKVDAFLRDLPAHDGAIHTFVCDLRQVAEVNDVVLKIKHEVGSIDILINNAGFALSATKPFWEQDIGDVDQVLQVSVNGLLYASHAVIKHHFMQQARPAGTVVNISSVTGHQAPPKASNEASYHTAKAAVEGFSNVLRHETLGTNIRVLVHRPGTVRTEFHERRHGYDDERVKDSYGGQRPLDPDDIAVGVLWQCMQPERISVVLMETYPTAQRSLYQCDKDWLTRNPE